MIASPDLLENSPRIYAFAAQAAWAHFLNETLVEFRPVRSTRELILLHPLGEASCRRGVDGPGAAMSRASCPSTPRPR